MTAPTSICPNGNTAPKMSELLSGISHVLGVMGNAVQQQEQHYQQQIEELHTHQSPNYTNIIANNKRKETAALLNALYESSAINKDKISKADFFARAAIMMGDDGLKDYQVMLSQELQTNKYENIFDDFKQTALDYRTNMWEKQKNIR